MDPYEDSLLLDSYSSSLWDSESTRFSPPPSLTFWNDMILACCYYGVFNSSKTLRFLEFSYRLAIACGLTWLAFLLPVMLLEFWTNIPGLAGNSPPLLYVLSSFVKSLKLFSDEYSLILLFSQFVYPSFLALLFSFMSSARALFMMPLFSPPDMRVSFELLNALWPVEFCASELATWVYCLFFVKKFKLLKLLSCYSMFWNGWMALSRSLFSFGWDSWFSIVLFMLRTTD